jgi:hypothetical protein
MRTLPAGAIVAASSARNDGVCDREQAAVVGDGHILGAPEITAEFVQQFEPRERLVESIDAQRLPVKTHHRQVETMEPRDAGARGITREAIDVVGAQASRATVPQYGTLRRVRQHKFRAADAAGRRMEHRVPARGTRRPGAHERQPARNELLELPFGAEPADGAMGQCG